MKHFINNMYQIYFLKSANCFQTMNRNVDYQEIGEHPWIDVKEPLDDALVCNI
jgi:hypothetical protein